MRHGICGKKGQVGAAAMANDGGGLANVKQKTGDRRLASLLALLSVQGLGHNCLEVLIEERITADSGLSYSIISIIIITDSTMR
jgi:hypothetical protein